MVDAKLAASAPTAPEQQLLSVTCRYTFTTISVIENRGNEISSYPHVSYPVPVYSTGYR
jgi:hypothetical protein